MFCFIPQAPREQVVFRIIAEDQSYGGLVVGSLNLGVYEKVPRGILHVLCASLGEAGVTPQNPQLVAKLGPWLRVTLSPDGQVLIAFMWFFELIPFFFFLTF
jgi:hypothetical protein